MAIKINQWKPDTCSCVMHWYYDDSVPDDQIVTTFFAIENACADHQHLLGIAKGAPDWVQPDHKVDTENAARFALVELSCAQNEERDLATVPLEHKETARKGIRQHEQKAIQMYANMFDPINDKAISRAVWDTVNEENFRKREALKIALQNGPTSLYDTDNGGISRTVKPGADFQFSWSGVAPGRILSIEFRGVSLTVNQKNTIRNALSSGLGPGKANLA